jgi:hypothetical protein
MIAWWIGLAAGGAILSLNLHELAHCLIVWIVGGKVTDYFPVPHWYNKDEEKVYFSPGEGRRFYFGRMQWTILRPRTRSECRWFYRIIPIRAATFLTMWLLLGLLCFLPLLALAFWDLMDLGDWLKDYLWKRETQDGGKFRNC